MAMSGTCLADISPCPGTLTECLQSEDPGRNVYCRHSLLSNIGTTIHIARTYRGDTREVYYGQLSTAGTSAVIPHAPARAHLPKISPCHNPQTQTMMEITTSDTYESSYLSPAPVQTVSATNLEFIYRYEG